MSAPVSLRRSSCFVGIKKPYLEVEDTGLGSGIVALAAALLEETVDLCRTQDCQLRRGWCFARP